MTLGSLWGRVEPLLSRVERPARYLNREWGAVHDDAGVYRAVLLYPDTYEIGQANQALQILYERINRIDGAVAERVYLPWMDMSEQMREAGVPLFSLESCSPVADFDLFGITVPYELCYTNIVEALDLAGIPLRAAQRSDGDTLVVGGGPCVFNPEPFAPFFDAILVGEGEDAVAEIIDAHREARVAGLDRGGTLRRLARVPGVYVPSLYVPGASSQPVAVDGAPTVVTKRAVSSLSEHRTPRCPVVPYMDVVHDRYAVEVLRGCTRGCRFCQAGMVYRPVRERTADEIVSAVMTGLACTGYDEASLTSLSTADHSQVEEVLRRLTRRLAGTGVSISLPSLRVDAFSVELARLVSSAKKTGLTFAPEAGTQRLRDVINKNVTEQDLLDTVSAAFSAGWRRVKLYFMIGLPTEQEEDVVAIARMVSRVLDAARESTPPAQRGAIRVGVSVSTFVPKASTPFQWEPQIEMEEVLRRQALLREHMPRKGVDLHWHDADVSFLEGVMARGGREVANVVEAAWRAGARFDAWTEQFDLQVWLDAFEGCGVDPKQIAHRQRATGEPLPWGHISAGVSPAYLVRELERAHAEKTTPDCSFGGCTGCDVCGDLGLDIVLAGGERR